MTKKLLLSVLTVVLTVVALGTTTFAWFTLTNTATVQPFEAEVVADAGIEISLDDVANQDVWVTTITAQMINDYITAKYGTFYFNHVTSPTGVNMYALGDTLQALPLTPQAGGFLEIGFRFRSNNASVINWTEVELVSPTGVNWVSDVPFTNTTGVVADGQTLNGMRAANGMRISMAGVVYERPGSALGTATTLPSDNTVLGGHTNASASDSDPLDPNFANYNANLLPGAINYYLAKTGGIFPEGANGINVPSTITDLGLTGVTVLTMIGDALGTTFVYSGAFIVRIWLEGWDPDTFNAVLADTIRARFVFKDPNS